MNAKEIQQRLSALDTPSICDAAKGLGRELRVMDSGMRRIGTGRPLVGTAHTLICHDDFLTVIKALGDAKPGEVLVIDSQNSTKAVTGNLFPTEALRKGLAGIVNDGPCRDTAIIRTMDIPYYARSVCCAPGATRRLFDTQIPITCGGVTVNPGDIVFGDEDGIVVGTVEEFDPLVPGAEEVQRKEAKLIEGMRQGTSLLEMLNFAEHCENVRSGKESKLEFRV
jgi:regulator of RNase E activity RraA